MLRWTLAMRVRPWVLLLVVLQSPGKLLLLLPLGSTTPSLIVLSVVHGFRAGVHVVLGRLLGSGVLVLHLLLRATVW